MRLTDYIAFERFRLAAFAAWWTACHEHAVDCETTGLGPKEMWPMDGEGLVYDEALQDFIGGEIMDLPEPARSRALELLPEEFHATLMSKTVTVFGS